MKKCIILESFQKNNIKQYIFSFFEIAYIKTKEEKSFLNSSKEIESNVLFELFLFSLTTSRSVDNPPVCLV